MLSITFCSGRRSDSTGLPAWLAAGLIERLMRTGLIPLLISHAMNLPRHHDAAPCTVEGALIVQAGQLILYLFLFASCSCFQLRILLNLN